MSSTDEVIRAGKSKLRNRGSVMKTLQLKPVIEPIEGGYQAKASLYQDNFHCATESFNAYDDKQEAWDNAKESSVKFIKNHNNNCKCGVKMTLGSF